MHSKSMFRQATTPFPETSRNLRLTRVILSFAQSPVFGARPASMFAIACALPKKSRSGPGSPGAAATPQRHSDYSAGSIRAPCQVRNSKRSARRLAPMSSFFSIPDRHGARGGERKSNRENFRTGYGSVYLSLDSVFQPRPLFRL